MTPVIKVPANHTFYVALRSLNGEVQVEAESIDIPENESDRYSFTRQGETVAQYECAEVIGWRVKPKPKKPKS